MRWPSYFSQSMYGLLWFVPDGNEDEDALLIGVYESEQEAELATGRLSNKPWIRGYPDHFRFMRENLGEIVGSMGLLKGDWKSEHEERCAGLGQGGPWLW